MSQFKASLFFGGTEAFDECVESSPPHAEAPATSATLDFIASQSSTNVSESSNSSANRAQSTFSRFSSASLGHGRVPGGRPPVHRPLVRDQDSDDERLMTLKQQGYTNEYVARKLVEEGRVRYKPKTIGSRWLKMKKIAAEREEERLEDEMSDWHVGDDDYLRESFNVAEEKYQRDLRILINKKWSNVSLVLAERMGRKKYTGNACRERWEALEFGTEAMPIELDPDRAGREAAQEARITANKVRRARQRGEAQWAKSEEERKRVADRAKAEAAWNLRESKKQEQKEGKLARKKIRAERKAGLIVRKRMQETGRAQWRQEIHEKKREKRLTRLMLVHLTGEGSSERRDDTVQRHGYRAEDSGTESEDSDASEDDQTDDLDDDNESLHYCFDDFAYEGKAKVTKATLSNPRSILTDDELNMLLFERGLSRRTSRETHAEIVARLAVADEALTSSQLTDHLAKHFDKCRGGKDVRIRRLQELDAEKSIAGQQGVKLTDFDVKRGYD